MTCEVMTEADIDRVVPLYIDYYNIHEGSRWTRETAYKKIHQVWSREDGYCLVAEEDGRPVGFVIGNLEQYDDLVAYYLAEIVIEGPHQDQGLGSALLAELERRLKEQGVSLIQLLAVNDAPHARFYERADYRQANSLILRTKWL